MKRVVMYQTQYTEVSELEEYFRHQGCRLQVVRNLTELMAGNLDCNEIYLEINSLSDIMLVGSLRTLYRKVEVVLIVQPRLRQIIANLSRCKCTTIGDITRIDKSPLTESIS
jgi:hypothetical protein